MGFTVTKGIRSALSAIVVIAATIALPAAASASVQVGSSGWQWGNPLPQGNSLHDIAFQPGTTTGYAVGDFGTILKTPDAGITWSGLPAGTFNNLTRVQVAADGSVIAGGGCVLRVSTTGGATFNRIPFQASEVTCNAATQALQAFSFLSAQNGYILLANGAVQHTTDGGQSFLSSTNGLPGTPGSPTGGTAKPTDIEFLADGLTGFASTTDGNIYRTTNGAQTWASVQSGTPQINRILFLDALHGYAVGNAGTFLSTVDGGTTWVAHTSGTTENLTGISCATLVSCVASTQTGDIIVGTPDGGVSFSQPHPPVEVNAVGYVSATQVVGVGNAGGTTVSADGGINYTSVGGPLPSTYNRLRAGGTANTAYAVGPSGALAQTTNGGASWSVAKVTGGANMIDVSFPSPSVGWALDSTGALYTTGNGAQSWKAIDTGSTAKANAVYATSASKVMVVGPKGVRISTNSGVDFTSNAKINLVPLTNVDKAGSALIVYGPSLILESTNGGSSWKSVLKPGKYHKLGTRMVNNLPVADVDFISAKVGFLLDGNGKLWSTKNTGKTWTELTATGTENATGMAFSSATKGYLIINTFGSVTTSSGFLLRTSDGGLTWHPQFIVSDPIKPQGLATSSTVDYLLSKNSNLLSTTTGGDRGSASQLSITPSVKALTKPETMQVTGKLTPATGFEQVVVSERPAGSGEWRSVVAKVDSNGKFTTSWSNLRKGDNLFVAQWQGDFKSVGAGTKTLDVKVGPKPKAKAKKK
jgi:photosystem II stability/assembly factor-like uncharacterized protein